jgi:hypothetical protein
VQKVLFNMLPKVRLLLYLFSVSCFLFPSLGVDVGSVYVGKLNDTMITIQTLMLMSEIKRNVDDGGEKGKPG